MEKPAPVEHEIHDLLIRRWSPRAMDPNRPLSREQVETLLEAARWRRRASMSSPGDTWCSMAAIRRRRKGARLPYARYVWAYLAPY